MIKKATVLALVILSFFLIDYSDVQAGEFDRSCEDFISNSKISDSRTATINVPFRILLQNIVRHATDDKPKLSILKKQVKKIRAFSAGDPPVYMRAEIETNNKDRIPAGWLDLYPSFGVYLNQEAATLGGSSKGGLKFSLWQDEDKSMFKYVVANIDFVQQVIPKGGPVIFSCYCYTTNDGETNQSMENKAEAPSDGFHCVGYKTGNPLKTL